jgi:hypothetical protein
LPNRIQLNCFDRSRHYYGGFFRVVIDVTCSVDLTPELFSAPREYAEAVSLLGNTVTFVRRLERMAVVECDLDAVKDELLSRFMATAESYLAAPEFPARLAQSEYGKWLKKGSPPKHRHR